MKNKQVKQMICDVELYKRNGCLPSDFLFVFEKGSFGYWVSIKSGWFFRGIYHGTASLTAEDLKNAKLHRCRKSA